VDTRALRNAFWRDLGPGSFALFLAAVFFTFASLGFLVDVLSLGRPSLAELTCTTLATGLISVAYAWAGTRARKWLPLVIGGQILVISFIPTLFPQTSGPLDRAALRQRLTLDVGGTIAFVTFGYVAFMVLLSREGVSAVELRTEIALAREIHRSLVPPIAAHVDGFEICGVSIPSGAVGGDLVDFVDEGGGAWMGYVADVSGHGVPAGLLMGMVKSATRTRLLSSTALASLLDDLNRIVFDVKRPNMFVTFAAIRSTVPGLEFTLAGHLPLLRVRPGATTVDQLSIAQIPLGILDAHTFGSAPVECAPGDLLVLVTDGLTEVFDRRDREFGLSGVEQALLESSDRPLAEIRDRLLVRVNAHGPQLDDQTLLLIRRVT